MGLRINQNIGAINAYRNLSATDNQLSKSLEKLSSGFRINRAADDAAGLVISESLRSQIGGLKVATRNAQDGVSLVQTAEGALTEVHSMLQRIRDLAVQASNGTNSQEAIDAAQAEVSELVNAIDDIASTTQFNGIQLLDGTGGTAGTITFQVGANAGETLDVVTEDMDSAALGIDGVNIFSGTGTALDPYVLAAAAITTIDTAIGDVSGYRASLGAAQNRLEHTVANLGVAVENLSASESRIRDTDMAQEMVQFTRAQILTQAGTAMLAQANASSQGVLQLLRG